MLTMRVKIWRNRVLEAILQLKLPETGKRADYNQSQGFVIHVTENGHAFVRIVRPSLQDLKGQRVSVFI